MSLLKKLAGETVIYGLSSIIGRLLNYLLVPIHTHIFLTEEYGVIARLYALTGFLMVLFIYRMETAYFRYGTDPQHREKAFSTGLLSIVVTTVLFSTSIICFSDAITAWLNYPPSDALFVIFFALILGFDALSEIPFAKLRLEQRPIRFAFIRIINIGLNIGLNIFFLVICPWILEQEGWAFAHEFISTIYQRQFGVGYVFLANLIASAVTFLLLLPSFGKLKWEFDRQLWWKMFSYAAPLILAGLAGIANEMLDRELLVRLLPYDTDTNEGELGIYSACYKLAMLMTLFTQAFRYAAEPFFFAQAKNKNAKALYAEVGKYFAIIGCLAFLFILFYLDHLKEFIDEPYWEGLKVVPILLLANLFLGLYYNLSVWYKLTDKTIMGAYIAFGGALITIVLNVLWIPTIGYMGSAWATLICYASMTTTSYFLGQRYYKVAYDLPRIALYIALAVGGYFSSLKFAEVLVGQTILLTVINTCLLLLFILIVYLLERKTVRELLS